MNGVQWMWRLGWHSTDAWDHVDDVRFMSQVEEWCGGPRQFAEFQFQCGMKLVEQSPKSAGMKCPFCTDGITGTDLYGEACDCYECDSRGWLSAERIKEVFEHRAECVITLMLIDMHVRERDIDAVIRDLADHARQVDTKRRVER